MTKIFYVFKNSGRHMLEHKRVKLEYFSFPKWVS